MNKKVLSGIIIGAVVVVLIATAVTVGIVVASKITCKHDNPYEIEILPYKAPTCQEEGLSQGKRCNYCGTVLVEQERINKKECKESNWIVDKEASLTQDGAKHTECTMCGRVMQQLVIAAGTQGLDFKLNDDDTYTLSGDGKYSHLEIVIPRANDGKIVTAIGNHAFMGNGAKSITIPNTIKAIGSAAFSGCSRLTNINIPEGVQSIGSYCFKSCKSLKNIVIPDSVTEIDHSAFWGCENLKTVTLPEKGLIISSYVFKGCSSLESIDLPDGMTEIGNATFASCTSLKSVTIPKTVTKILSEAFCNCTSLTTIKFEGTVEQWNSIYLVSSWRVRVPATEVICSNGTVPLN